VDSGENKIQGSASPSDPTPCPGLTVRADAPFARVIGTVIDWSNGFITLSPTGLNPSNGPTRLCAGFGTSDVSPSIGQTVEIWYDPSVNVTAAWFLVFPRCPFAQGCGSVSSPTPTPPPT